MILTIIILALIVCCLIIAILVIKAPELKQMSDLKPGDIFYTTKKDSEHNAYLVKSNIRGTIYCESRNMGLTTYKVDAFGLVYFDRNIYK